jgi:hypothetical protein
VTVIQTRSFQNQIKYTEMDPEIHYVNLAILSRQESPGLFSIMVYCDLFI